jgi:hypothetical protein
MKILVPALAGALLVAGCVVQQPSYPAPPPLPAEVIPLPPVSDAPLTWRPGDWVFAGGSYRYDAGRYVPAVGHGRNWMFAHWAVGPQGGMVWVPGGWAG